MEQVNLYYSFREDEKEVTTIYNFIDYNEKPSTTILVQTLRSTTDP